MFTIVPAPWIRPLGVGGLLLIAGFFVWEVPHLGGRFHVLPQMTVGVAFLAGLFLLKGIGKKVLMLLGVVGCIGWASASMIAAKEPGEEAQRLSRAADYPRGGCSQCTGFLLDGWLTRAPRPLRTGWLSLAAGTAGEPERISSAGKPAAILTCSFVFSAIEGLATNRNSDRNAGDVQRALTTDAPMPSWASQVAGSAGSAAVREAFARPYPITNIVSTRPGKDESAIVLASVAACVNRFPKLAR